MDFQGINPNFAVASSEGPAYPWLQATDYQPRNGSTKISLVLPEDAVELIDPSELDKIKFEPAEIATDSGNTPAFVPQNIRWVILGYPKSFKIDKEGKVSTIEKGVKWNGEFKSVARVFLAAVVDDRFILDNTGQIQIFTLKLKGLKTEFVRSSDPNVRTIQTLNEAICKAYKKRGWMAYLVSVELEVVPRQFKMMNGSSSSWGCYFQFKEGSGARPLPEALQAQAHSFVTSDEFLSLANDPFNINGETSPEESEPSFVPSVSDNDDGIPF